MLLLLAVLSTAALAQDLSDLVVTKRQGKYTLRPTWAGEERVLPFKSQPSTNAVQKGTVHQLQFDTFYFCDPPLWEEFGKRFVCQIESEDLLNTYSYRESLPKAREFIDAKSLSSLTKHFGLAPQSMGQSGIGDGENQKMRWTGTFKWSFFTLKDKTTMETLSVTCFVSRQDGESDWRVAGFEIGRGSAKPLDK